MIAPLAFASQPPRIGHANRAPSAGRVTATIAIATGALGTALATLLATSCAPVHGPADWVAVHEVTPSFLLQLDAADPWLAAAPHGHVALTWVSGEPEHRNLWLAISRDSGLTFTEPVRLNVEDGSVVSTPESRPVAVFGPRSELAIAWSDWTGVPGATSLVVRTSGDGGINLGRIVRVNDDAAWDTTGAHGHATLAYLTDGALFAAWLEDRILPYAERGDYWRWWHRHAAMPNPPVALQLMSSTSVDGGQSWGPNRLLADSASACSRPVARAGANGAVAVAYRRALGGIRDPALIVIAGDAVRDTLMSADGWRTEACPSDGPAIAWSGPNGGVYAWTTGAGRPGLNLVPWHDAQGASGTGRRIADSLANLRAPLLTPFGTEALLGVLAQSPDDSTREVFAVRALADDGGLTAWTLLGADARSPALATLDQHTALAAWIERDGARGRLRVVQLSRR